MELKTRYTFSKKEKLKSRKAIEQLFRTGKSFSVFPFRIIWNKTENSEAPLQAGFTVSSKYFKRAVDRNRIKRLMREALRLQKKELQDHLAKGQNNLSVFFIYVGNELPDHQFIFEKTAAVLKRLIKLSNENNIPDT